MIDRCATGENNKGTHHRDEEKRRNQKAATGRRPVASGFSLCLWISVFQKAETSDCQKSLTNFVPGCDTIPIFPTHGCVILGPLKPGGA